MDQITTIVGVLGTVLTSAGIWKFFEKRIKLQQEERAEEREEKTMYRTDLKERVKKLEDNLQAALEQNQKLQQTILDITRDNQKLNLEMSKQIAVLETTVGNLKEEVKELEKENKILKLNQH